MTFSESTTVENLFRDLLAGGHGDYTAVGPGFARKNGKITGLGWHHLPPANVPRPGFEKR
jgi:type I restriction enzyme R subunit